MSDHGDAKLEALLRSRSLPPPSGDLAARIAREARRTPQRSPVSFAESLSELLGELWLPRPAVALAATINGCSVAAQEADSGSAQQGRVAMVASDIKDYVTAPLHAGRPQWVRFGVAVGAIALAHEYDDDVREHFATVTAAPGTVMVSVPDAIAESYWHIHSQPRSAWTHELDVRPWAETW